MGNFAKCRRCGKQIMFIKMKSGKSMPVDSTFVNFRMNSGGKDRIVLTSGEVIACDANVDSSSADGYGYISHFATCHNAGRQRKKV